MWTPQRLIDHAGMGQVERKWLLSGHGRPSCTVGMRCSVALLGDRCVQAHLDDLGAQLAAVANKIAKSTSRVRPRLFLLVRQQHYQRSDCWAKCLVQRRVVEAGVADRETCKLPASTQQCQTPLCMLFKVGA